MKLTALLMIGIGLSGIIMNVLRMILLATITSYDAGEIVFFSISSIFLYFCSFLAY